MELTSSVFTDSQLLPLEYTCDGDNINPSLTIDSIPADTKSLTLIVDDPDAPNGDWVHWLVWNIDPSVAQIEEGSIPTGGIEGTTDFNTISYNGPCPPSGEHRYQFKLYALDTLLDLDSTATKPDVVKAMEGHILAETMLTGLYHR